MSVKLMSDERYKSYDRPIIVRLLSYKEVVIVV